MNSVELISLANILETEDFLALDMTKLHEINTTHKLMKKCDQKQKKKIIKLVDGPSLHKPDFCSP